MPEPYRPDPDALALNVRFRRIGGPGYPPAVLAAYDRDMNRALAATDAEVAATVAGWETAQGRTPTDWPRARMLDLDLDPDDPAAVAELADDDAEADAALLDLLDRVADGELVQDADGNWREAGYDEDAGR